MPRAEWGLARRPANWRLRLPPARSTEAGATGRRTGARRRTSAAGAADRHTGRATKATTLRLQDLLQDAADHLQGAA